MSRKKRHLDNDDWLILDQPYFVYGTLRPGCGNDQAWRDFKAECLLDGLAILRGYKLVMGNHLPYAVRTYNLDDEVVGAMIFPPEELNDAQWLRKRLDRLEGHPMHYERISTVVELPETCVEAWVYTPTKWTVQGRILRSGDYADLVRDEAEWWYEYDRADLATE